MQLLYIIANIETNGKSLAAIGKFLSAIFICKLMIGRTLSTNGEEITNAMFGNDEALPLGQIGND